MYVSILQKNKKDVTSLLIFGSIALVFSFSIYYLLPLSLLSFNFSLAMSVSLAVLFGMIFALAIISINLMPYINFMVAKFVMIFEEKSMKLVVLKNLIAHKDRNRNTALVFSLLLGFIMYLNIASRLPFAKELNEHQNNGGIRSI